MIYVFYFHDTARTKFVKVGYSTNPESRRAQIQKEIPFFEVFIDFFIPGSLDDELKLHDYMRSSVFNKVKFNEWYLASDPHVAHTIELLRANNLLAAYSYLTGLQYGRMKDIGERRGFLKIIGAASGSLEARDGQFNYYISKTQREHMKLVFDDLYYYCMHQPSALFVLSRFGQALPAPSEGQIKFQDPNLADPDKVGTNGRFQFQRGSKNREWLRGSFTKDFITTLSIPEYGMVVMPMPCGIRTVTGHIITPDELDHEKMLKDWLRNNEHKLTLTEMPKRARIA